jgi:hypothetical protein
MRALAAAAMVLSSFPAAAAREADPQAHEVRIDLDIAIERQANAALFDAQYTFTPETLNRTDEVVPTLRRFVRRASAIWARVIRLGYTRESVTGGALGGILHLGPVHASAELGIEHDLVDYDPGEHAYWALPVTAELGFRPINLLSVGGFYTGRYIVGAIRNDKIPGLQAERSGTDHQIGVRLAYATPTDRLWIHLSAWRRMADWSFDEFHPGDVTIRGLGAAARVAFQLSPTFTLALRGEVHRDHWVNDRLGDDSPIFVGAELDRQVAGGSGGVEIVFWHRGRYGFRFGIGGGYEGAPPTVDNRETAILQIQLGMVTRF